MATVSARSSTKTASGSQLDTFITELSSVISNWPAARVKRTA